MRSSMSVEAKRELLLQVAPRYREATHAEKSIILNEFLESTGYARKYGIRLLSGPVQPPVKVRRTRPRRYGPAVQEAPVGSNSSRHRLQTKTLHFCATEPSVEPIAEHNHLSSSLGNA